MKRKDLITGLILILLGSSVLGQVKNQRDTDGRKQGYWEATDRNGKLVYRGYFKNDKPVGEMTRYYPDGGVRVIMVYDETSEKARARFFWQNGEPAAEGNYVHTKRDSIWVYYSYYTKTVSNKTAYTAGKRNGSSLSFYPDGEIAEEVWWKEDMKDGVWKQYFENGRLKLSAAYRNGKLEGEIITYYPDGKKETEGKYRQDVPDGKWVHYLNDGKIASTIEYVNGQIANLDEVLEAEQEFFRKIEEQKDRINEPTLDDMLREAGKMRQTFEN
jgi:antitoxin component YwqK of YwqJK toxin-antitoxin module